jgi:hypothetical protein
MLFLLNYYRYKHGTCTEERTEFPSFDVPQSVSTCAPSVARQMSRWYPTYRQVFRSIRLAGWCTPVESLWLPLHTSESLSRSAIPRQMDGDRGALTRPSGSPDLTPLDFNGGKLRSWCTRWKCKMWTYCVAGYLQLVRLLHEWCCKTLGKRWSMIRTFVWPLRAHMWRSTEEHQNLETLTTFQCNSHISTYIGLRNIFFK